MQQTCFTDRSLLCGVRCSDTPFLRALESRAGHVPGLGLSEGPSSVSKTTGFCTRVFGFSW